MGFVKLVKNRQYYKRYKTKFRRRRECKTNYRCRAKMIRQDKRKHNVAKWRYVVRITNQDVICQIVAAKLIGDHVLCAAYSHELIRYGLTVGLTNYAACYCTGLLLARRLLKKLKLDKFYPGKKKIDGNMYRSHVAAVSWQPGQKIFRPFKAVFDRGLAFITTGGNIWGALKGAIDGGLDIPHSPNRFPGFKKSSKPKQMGKKREGDEYDAEAHKKKIFGDHVAAYMSLLQEKEPEKYQKHFSRYIAAGLGPENLADKYRQVHKAIRENPAAAPKKNRKLEDMQLPAARQKKLTAEERRLRRIAKIEELAKKGQEEEDNVAVGMDVEVGSDDEDDS